MAQRLSDAFVETVAAPWFANAATGTPVLTLWLRLLGAHIGRGVWCETYWLPEADLVTLADGAAVQRGLCGADTLFHDRVMAIDTVELDEVRRWDPLCGPARRAHRHVGNRRSGVVGHARRRRPRPHTLAGQPHRTVGLTPEPATRGAEQRRVTFGAPSPPQSPRSAPRSTACLRSQAVPQSGRVSPVLGSPVDVIDDYPPESGNLGYRVSRYDLELGYRVAPNRLTGVATITATATSHVKQVQLDLAPTMAVARVTVNGERCATPTVGPNWRSR